MNPEEVTEIFREADLFEEISCISEMVYNALDLDEDQRQMLDSFFGQALDEVFAEGVSVGMAEIISEDLDLEDENVNM